MRLIAFLEYAAVVIGIGAMIAGHFFALPKGFQLGVFLVGGGLALGGLGAVLTRRMAFRLADDAYENYAGAPALIVGLMALAIGAGFIGSAYLLDMGQWHATVHYLMRRPAPLLAVGGLFLIGTGVLMTLNPLGRQAWVWRILVYAPRVAAGLLVIAAGVAGIGLGAWEWLDSKAFRAFVCQPGFTPAFCRPIPPRVRCHEPSCGASIFAAAGRSRSSPCAARRRCPT